ELVHFHSELLHVHPNLLDFGKDDLKAVLGVKWRRRKATSSRMANNPRCIVVFFMDSRILRFAVLPSRACPERA
ncbi:MAG: hypothetical protein OSB18_12175, partial [SAR324 cluster bacterium]|nr:hypothetical protein [SAR324 cluster bacterium]